MKKFCNGFILFALAAVILLGNCLPVYAAQEPAVVQGKPVCCENLTLLDNGNYYCILVDVVEGAEAFSNPPADAVQGEPVCCENLTLLDNGNYYCILVDVVEETEVSCDPQQAAKTFVYNMYDCRGEWMAEITITVTGVYSETEHTAQISSAAACNRAAQISGLSYSVSHSGDTAVVSIWINGLKIGSFTYELTTSGCLQQIA